MKCLSGGAVLLILLASSFALPEPYAAELRIPHVEAKVVLTKDTIVPGEPVNLRFTFTNIAEGRVSISLDNPVNPYTEEQTGLLMTIRDAKGKSMPSRMQPCQPASQTILGSAHLDPGEELVVDYPLQLQVSTRLEEGQYTVSATGFDVCNGYYTPEYLDSVGKAVKTTQVTRESFSVKGLPLTVAPQDEAKLSAAYESLMAEARYALDHPSGSWWGEDFDDIPVPIRTLLWAYGPEAVPYQIELVYGEPRGFYWPPATVHTWANIAEYATVEQVERLVELASNMESPKPDMGYSRHYAPGLVWALHQLHDQGSAPMKACTQDIVTRLPEEELCPRAMETGVMPYGKG